MKGRQAPLPSDAAPSSLRSPVGADEVRPHGLQQAAPHRAVLRAPRPPGPAAAATTAGTAGHCLAGTGLREGRAHDLAADKARLAGHQQHITSVIRRAVTIIIIIAI